MRVCSLSFSVCLIFQAYRSFVFFVHSVCMCVFVLSHRVSQVIAIWHKYLICIASTMLTDRVFAVLCSKPSEDMEVTSPPCNLAINHQQWVRQLKTAMLFWLINVVYICCGFKNVLIDLMRLNLLGNMLRCFQSGTGLPAWQTTDLTTYLLNNKNWKTVFILLILH